MSNADTFVLKEVIDDLMNADKSLVSPLMKLLYFGKSIKNSELIEYTTNEIEGYKDHELVPEYRKSPARLLVDFQIGGTQHLNREVPISMLPEPFNTKLQFLTIGEGIQLIEKFADQLKEENDFFGMQIPMEMLPHIQPAVSKLYRAHFRVVTYAGRVTTNPGVVIQILSSVRSKLLSFAMNIGEKFGYNIEISTFNKDQEHNNQIIINVMHTEITNTGDGNVVNTGNEANITANITISKGDYNQLSKVLEEQGIEKEDIQELHEIIKVEQPDFENKRLGEKTNGWLSKIYNKTLNGVGKIATSATGNLLAALIKQYYGMDS